MIFINLQAENICYSVLCVFSYVAAGHERKKQRTTGAHRNTSPTASTASLPVHTEARLATSSGGGGGGTNEA